MKVKWISLFAATLLFSLAIVGCSSSNFPAGDFTRKLEGQELTLSFDKDGNFEILRNGREFSKGTYAVEGSQLKWLTDSSCSAPNGETATYSWAFADQTLTFSVVEDDTCIARLYILEKLPYRKLP